MVTCVEISIVLLQVLHLVLRTLPIALTERLLLPSCTIPMTRIPWNRAQHAPSSTISLLLRLTVVESFDLSPPQATHSDLRPTSQAQWLVLPSGLVRARHLRTTGTWKPSMIVRTMNRRLLMTICRIR